MKKHFKAPWSTKLKLITGAFIVFFIVSSFFADTTGSLLLFAIFLGCAFFAVRGYSIFDGKLLIHRMGWSKKFDLSNLMSAEFSPGATMGSIRMWGIGGLLGFIGYYRNSILGSYRSYATNRENTVVLDFSGKKVVVTPEKPVEFVQAVERAK